MNEMPPSRSDKHIIITFSCNLTIYYTVFEHEYLSSDRDSLNTGPCISIVSSSVILGCTVSNSGMYPI